MHPHVALLVKSELEQLLMANFIRIIDYAEWISNIVLVSKHDKLFQVCTNFRDLNKAFPKDEFPLPNIDMIVDMTIGYAMYPLWMVSLDTIRSKLLLRIKRKLPSHVHGVPFVGRSFHLALRM